MDQPHVDRSLADGREIDSASIVAHFDDEGILLPACLDPNPSDLGLARRDAIGR